jgi:hypothetical protein
MAINWSDVPSRDDDPVEKVRFGDGHVTRVAGHGGALEAPNDNVCLAISMRNGGAGVAVLHLYIPARDRGFWQGVIRDSSDGDYQELRAAWRSRARLMVDLLYGDNADQADPRDRPSGSLRRQG